MTTDTAAPKVRLQPPPHDGIDRLTPQTRPGEPVVGHQRWHSMLFLHWALPAEALRPHVPERLSVDTYAGQAYVSFALFTVVGARLRPLPPLPGLSRFHELNVRTYVHREGGAPGIWFFSLDASNPIACALARASLRLPYFVSRMHRERVDDHERFRSRRYQLGGSKAQLEARWHPRGAMLDAPAGSVEHFLTQRFFLYSPAFSGMLWRQQVHHAPWPLFSAEVSELEQTLDEALELPFLSRQPVAHASPGVDVEFYPPHLS